MSSIYVTEPPTAGKVLITTNRGEVEIELWSKEAPKASRNFVQLCLEGYYVDTIFHRLVPDFIIQGGDPTATGTGGQSIYDDPFQDEFHSRLRFNRRGLVGMANNGKHDNGSQFFITLDGTPELQGKNTLFGRVVGDTIYNVAKMGQSELEEGTERPLYPPRITKTEVISNPFSDIVPRTTREELERRRNAQKKSAQPQSKSVKKNRKLLSFDDGEDNEASEVVSFKSKSRGKSVQDLLPLQETAAIAAQKQPSNPRKRKVSSADNDEVNGSSITNDLTKETTTTGSPQQIVQDDPSPSPKIESNGGPDDSIADQIAALKSTLKRKQKVIDPPVKEEKLSSLAQQRLLYARKAVIGGKKARRGGEEDVMAALASFQSKISARPTAPEKPRQSSRQKQDKVCALHSVPNCQSCFDVLAESDDDEGWYTNRLVFESDKLGKDASFRERAEQELEMIDPREKAGQLALKAREERRRADQKSGRNQYLRPDGRRQHDRK